MVMSATVMVSAGSVGRRAAVEKRQAPTEGDFTDRSSDGSYAFRYADRNQFHSAAANKDNVVSGRYLVLTSVIYVCIMYIYTNKDEF